MDSPPPDVLVLGPEWPERALLRAQLIEEGYDVIAVDAWPIAGGHGQPDMTPRVLLIDLRGLPDPRGTLENVRLIIPANRVLVVTAIGTLTGEEVRRFGFGVVERPVTIGDIVAAVNDLSDVTARDRRARGSSSRADRGLPRR